MNTPPRRLLTRLAAFASLFAIVAVFASCGGDDDDDPAGGGEGGNSTASFCDEVKSILTSDPGEGAEQQARRFENAIKRLQDIEPPDEIANDWNAVMKAWDAQDAGDVDIEATQKAGQQVQRYLGDECNLTEQNTN